MWPAMPDAYALRAFTAADLPMMADWLATPHLRQWWGDPVEELALVTEDLDNPLMDQQIGLLGPCAFAYLQSYPCHEWGAAQFHDRPEGSQSVDMCVGLPDMLGHGHGAAILRLYAQTLIARGAKDVVIDPAPDNERALRCYRRAGFRDVAIRPGEEGDPVLVMEFHPDPAFSS
jgi:aminoglycoside 6'-N-acetyltransferase